MGYQITQKYGEEDLEGHQKRTCRVELSDMAPEFKLTAPLATGGFINLLPNHDGLPYPLSVPLVQLQIEQDTARSLVLSSPTFTNFRHYALVGIDLNRAGVGLVEIVTQPSMRSGVEAASFVRKLVATLEHIGSVRTGGMEGGVFRVDVNVSVVPLGADPLSGTRVEVKNLNSIRSVSRAVDHEALRHITLLESNPSQLVKETRHWDELKDITVSNRAKEEKEDYRYMPDGDLPVLKVSEDLISELRSGMPQLPDQIRESLIERHGPNGLAAEVAVKLLNEPGAASYFESLVNDIYARRQQLGNNDKSVKDPANWLVQTLFGVLHGVGLTVETAGFRGLGAEVVGEVVHLAETGRVSRGYASRGLRLEIELISRVFDLTELSAKYILQDIANGDTRPPLEIASSKQLLQDSSESSLLPLVQQVVGSNPEKAEQVKSGKTGLVGWFVGEIRRKSEGKQADPVVLKKLVERELGLGDKA